MQKISFGNRDYVRASEAAKRFKYTQDYVGQLCRSDKVDARLVGRVWYVNLDSVTEYRKTKHSTQKAVSNKKLATTAVKKKGKRSTVAPVVRPKTARKLQETFPEEARGAVVKHLSAIYSRDREAMIPVLQSGGSIGKIKNKPKPKHSNLAAEQQPAPPKVTIKVRPNTKKSTRYHAEKIPEITLKSKLKVTDRFENLVPESAEDVHVNTAKSTVEKNQDLVVSTASKSQARQVASAGFHPKSVSIEVEQSAARFLPSAYYKYIATALYFISISGAVMAIMGVAYFNDTGIAAATSGLMFSFDQVLENFLEVTQ